MTLIKGMGLEIDYALQKKRTCKIGYLHRNEDT